MIKELDCVALTADLPEHGLAAGDVGAVVHVYAGGKSYQVEFTTFDGNTIALAKVSADQIRPLGGKEIHHARAFAPGAGTAQMEGRRIPQTTPPRRNAAAPRCRSRAGNARPTAPEMRCCSDGWA